MSDVQDGCKKKKAEEEEPDDGCKKKKAEGTDEVQDGCKKKLVPKKKKM